MLNPEEYNLSNKIKKITILSGLVFLIIVIFEVQNLSTSGIIASIFSVILSIPFVFGRVEICSESIVLNYLFFKKQISLKEIVSSRKLDTQNLLCSSLVLKLSNSSTFKLPIDGMSKTNYNYLLNL
jgi:hypothetical protein